VLLETAPDAEVAERIGRTENAVRLKRTKLRIRLPPDSASPVARNRHGPAAMPAAMVAPMAAGYRRSPPTGTSGDHNPGSHQAVQAPAVNLLVKALIRLFDLVPELVAHLLLRT